MHFLSCWAYFFKSKPFKHHFCPNIPQTCSNFPKLARKELNKNMTSNNNKGLHFFVKSKRIQRFCEGIQSFCPNFHGFFPDFHPCNPASNESECERCFETHVVIFTYIFRCSGLPHSINIAA